MILTTLVACSTGTLQVDVPGNDTGVSDADTGDTAIGEEGCEEYPDLPLYDGSPAEGKLWHPRWVAPGFVGSVDQGAVHDFVWEGELFSSYFYFNVADEEAENTCVVYYDLSEAEPASVSWTTNTGGLLFEAWDLVLRDGFSDCGPIVTEEWGFGDLRDLFEDHEWGLGFGEPVEVAEYMSENVEDWETRWEPYMVSGYVRSSAISDDVAYEVGYAVGVEAECGVAVLDWNGEPTYLPAAQESPLPSSIWQGAAVYALDLDRLK